MTDHILRLGDIMQRTGKSRSSIYQAIKDGTFPKQINIGARSVGWLASEVEAWIDCCIEQRRQTLVVEEFKASQ
jgi:prophage regulatory protein